MSVQALNTEADYDAALARLAVLLDAANDSSRNEELSALAALIEAYEEKHFPIPPISFVAATWDELDSEDFSDLATEPIDAPHESPARPGPARLRREPGRGLTLAGSIGPAAQATPMKDVDFKNLLQGIREAGPYLRGNKKASARVDHMDPESVAAIRAKAPHPSASALRIEQEHAQFLRRATRHRELPCPLDR